jgi:saccharopepsin
MLIKTLLASILLGLAQAKDQNLPQGQSVKLSKIHNDEMTLESLAQNVEATAQKYIGAYNRDEQNIVSIDADGKAQFGIPISNFMNAQVNLFNTVLNFTNFNLVLW